MQHRFAHRLDVVRRVEDGVEDGTPIIKDKTVAAARPCLLDRPQRKTIKLDPKTSRVVTVSKVYAPYTLDVAEEDFLVVTTDRGTSRWRVDTVAEAVGSTSHLEIGVTRVENP